MIEKDTVSFLFTYYSPVGRNSLSLTDESSWDPFPLIRSMDGWPLETFILHTLTAHHHIVVVVFLSRRRERVEIWQTYKSPSTPLSLDLLAAATESHHLAHPSLIVAAI